MKEAARVVKPYKIVSGWMEVSDYQKEDNGRPLSMIAIGEIQEDGKVDYIFEEIYKDILENIKSNGRLYKIEVKLGNVPQLIICMNNGLIQHNPTVKAAVNRVEKLLDRVSEELIINGYLEMRLNMESKSKLGNATIALVSIINSAEGTQYPAPFIRSIIISRIESKLFPVENDNVATYLRYLDYADLIAVVSDIHRLRTQNTVNDRTLQEAISNDNLSVDDLQHIVGMELTYRLYAGILTER